MTRALVFAHYDRDGRVDDYVADALEKYRPFVDCVVFVSASAARLPPVLEPLVDCFVPRDNIGYDFCSWRTGLDALGPTDRYDEVIFANDSVYGPLFELGPVLADRRVADADMWGMCLSEQGTKRRGRRASCPHIQSWFFAMRRPVLESETFRRFWDSVVPIENKHDIVDRYEIGMTEHFVRAGFRIAALYDARQHGPATLREIWPHVSWSQPRRSWRNVKKARRLSHNPSELFPLRLIDAGVPFAKAGIFRVNHYGLNLNHALRGIRERTAYDVGLIERHLARVGRGA
ncbi:MAG: rhamnan synthesis F family protein [Planctomycetia bacterium]